MILKRKRSDSEISSCSSLLSSPLSASNFMALDSPQCAISTPSLFSSRTRKRHRDDRPSDCAVHQHTLSLLFSAQQNAQPQSQFLTTVSPVISHMPMAPRPSATFSQQPSLHSFWGMPNSTRQSSPSSVSSTASLVTSKSTQFSSFDQATQCEDCNTLFSHVASSNTADMDMMMDIDIEGGNYACASCNKQVCHSCAVSNLGADRKCLNCAKPRKRWVGGIGWMDQY